VIRVGDPAGGALRDRTVFKLVETGFLKFWQDGGSQADVKEEIMATSSIRGFEYEKKKKRKKKKTKKK